MKNTGNKSRGTWKSLTQITTLHLIRLVYRSLLFLTAAVLYILGRLHIISTLIGQIAVLIISAVFFVEMVFRFFPSKYESMGCQKQFAKNYMERATTPEDIAEMKRLGKRQAAVSAVSWIALNAVIALLYFRGVIDEGIMVLICLAYAVCDMICILFFCPFQSWMMKNRCCVTCRIYNWDYAMMFTPLLFIGNIIGYILFIMAAILLARWEITYWKHPERFSEITNAGLDCVYCTEKLCKHKKSIQKFLMEQKKQIFGR